MFSFCFIIHWRSFVSKWSQTPRVIFVCNNNNNAQHTCSAVNTNQAHNKMQSGCSQRRLAGTITDSRACSLSGGTQYPVRWALIVNKAMNMNTDDVWCQCCCGKSAAIKDETPCSKGNLIIIRHLHYGECCKTRMTLASYLFKPKRQNRQSTVGRKTWVV